MSDFSERLKKLGFNKAASLPPVKPRINKSLADILGAREISSRFGEVLIFEDSYPYGSLHGDVTISLDENFEELHKLAKMQPLGSGIQKHLFIDTETTGLSGGTGTIPFLIGFGYFDESGFQLRQLILESPVNEPAQLVEFARISENFENTITFNGKSFDLPLLRSRYILNKIPDPLAAFAHIDLLHLSRKIWKSRLPDRSLKELERQILRYSRSSDEVPGWMIPQIYFDFLKSGDGTLLKNVSYHNAIDVVSMAALYTKINLMLNETVDRQNINLSDFFAIGQMYEQINENEKALHIYNICFNSKSFGKNDLMNLCKHLAVLYRKQELWNEAVEYWKICADMNDMDSCVALAKYYEHINKNISEALDWVRKAETILLPSSISTYRKKRLLDEIEVRKLRLQRSVKYVQE